MNKDLIKKRFSRSISSYDKQATVQLLIADRLCQKASEVLINKCDSLLEIGCGTGFLTRKVLENFKIGNYYLNDLVGNLESRLQPIINQDDKNTRFSFFEGDAERIEFPRHLNAILSASTVQWFDDIDSFLSKVDHLLTTDGYFIFNSFGPENLKEIKQLIGTGLSYPPMSTITLSIEKKLELVECWEEMHEQYFDSSLEVLKHLQETGVNASSEPYRWTKTKLQNFDKQYRMNYSYQNKVKLSWQVYYFVVKKRN